MTIDLQNASARRCQYEPCGREFLLDLRQSRTAQEKRKFCSRDCYYKGSYWKTEEGRARRAALTQTSWVSTRAERTAAITSALSRPDVRQRHLSGLRRQNEERATVSRCQQCQKEFRGGRRVRKFCSQPCFHAHDSARKLALKAARPVKRTFVAEKRCIECDQVKPRDQFPFDAHGRAMSGYCLGCIPIRDERRRHASFLQMQQWQRDNPEKVKARKQRRLARQVGGDLTLLEWYRILRDFNRCCAYCGTNRGRMEQDHVLPLARGGAHAISNVVPACRHCNASKSDKTVAEWSASLAPEHPVRLRLIQGGA